MSYVKLENIGVSYANQQSVLKNFNLSIQQGEFISLLGPSGCGKTTTLRVMAGLIQANEGKFIVDGNDLTKTPVEKRQFGLVFQSYALFPHYTVFENIAFGLKLRKVNKEEIQQRVANMINLCDLSGFENRYPNQLSGGQRQRVALARAMVIEPKLLLLDEPLSNLDAKLRLQMRIEIKKIHQKLKTTTLFVTHDQEECFSISDKVAIMNKGIIEQFDTPQAIYENPATEFVARFIGYQNFIPVQSVINNKAQITNDCYLTTKQSYIDKKFITIRPDNISFADSMKENCIKGTIEVKTYLGRGWQYIVNTDFGQLTVNDTSLAPRLEKENCILYLDPQKITMV